MENQKGAFVVETCNDPENNAVVVETLNELKNNEAFVTMLENDVLRLRAETYEDLDAPEEPESQVTTNDINAVVDFTNKQDLYVVVFVDGIECINILDL